ncbi:toxin Cry1Ac domain D-VI-related protein [Lactiplantibacillus pentosus]|uniref:toxin Cry1Ac domain D-VI-related protein n=1 Tax=Lactiplantibacillus pentosus TaxID=1589 RepID=UPI002182014D|nr:toxin Cry1Ac domain D-VI-related protein [Lactiplantibacillus pentosus]MCT0162921.1 hypothetical protein [Lactiplantibacillus pentosus]
MTAGGDNSKSSESSTKHSTSSEKASPLSSKAKTDVDSLFDDSDHTELLGGTTLGSIKSVSTEVNKLPRSKAKDELTKDITTAKKLWPEFAKETSQKDASSSSKESQKLAEQDSKESAAKASSKAKESSEKASSVAKAKITYSGSKNRVYGKLTSSSFHRDPKTALYKTSKSNTLNYVQISVLPKTKEIRMVHLDFTDAPLLPESNDWKDYLPDWIESDAVKTGQKVSDTEWNFTSAKIGKTYKMKLTWNDEPAVTNINNSFKLELNSEYKQHKDVIDIQCVY